MEYFVIFTKNSKKDVFVFHELTTDERVVLKEKYRKFVCKKCGKFDEDKALKSGLTERIWHPSTDFFHTIYDCFTVVSKRVRNAFINAGTKGVKFIPISQKTHYIIEPTIFLPLKKPKEAMDFYNKKQCKICGRYPEVRGIPRAASMKNLPESNTIFSPIYRIEGRNSRKTLIYATADVVKMLKKKAYTGVIYRNWS